MSCGVMEFSEACSGAFSLIALERSPSPSWFLSQDKGVVFPQIPRDQVYLRAKYLLYNSRELLNEVKVEERQGLLKS